MMRVTLIRHGESLSNIAGRWQGQGDSPLSERGLEQARALGHRLRSVPFDHIICSDLTRAVQTATALNRDFERDPQWRELDIGVWEGLTRAEVAQRYPHELAALVDDLSLPMGGGESWHDLDARVGRALDELRTRFTDGSHIAIVCHGGVIMTLISARLGVLDRQPRALGRVLNTAICTIEISSKHTRLLRYNDALHWPQISETDRVVPVEISLVTGPDSLPERLHAAANANGARVAVPAESLFGFANNAFGFKPDSLCEPLRGASIRDDPAGYTLIDWEVGTPF